jgi:NADH-quinone oxidoreductase subunit N
VAYFLTTTGAFGILVTLSDKDRDAEQIEDYRGLFWRRPLTAAIFTAMLLSLAGIPLTAGFVGKFYIVAAGVNTQHWLLVVMLALNSAIGLYYYIKLVAVMFQKELEIKARTEVALTPSVFIVSGVTLGGLVSLLLWIGIYPDTLIVIIKELLIVN